MSKKNIRRYYNETDKIINLKGFDFRYHKFTKITGAYKRGINSHLPLDY